MLQRTTITLIEAHATLIMNLLDADDATTDAAEHMSKTLAAVLDYTQVVCRAVYEPSPCPMWDGKIQGMRVLAELLVDNMRAINTPKPPR